MCSSRLEILEQFSLIPMRLMTRSGCLSSLRRSLTFKRFVGSFLLRGVELIPNNVDVGSIWGDPPYGALNLRAHDPSMLAANLGTTLAGAPTTLSDESLDALLRYPWPGNVRELRNVLERAMLIARGQPRIELLHLPREVHAASGAEVAHHEPRSLADVEKAHAAGGINQHIAADDGVALHFEGTKLKRIVSSLPRASAWRLQRAGRRAIETRLPARYLGRRR